MAEKKSLSNSENSHKNDTSRPPQKSSSPSIKRLITNKYYSLHIFLPIIFLTLSVAVGLCLYVYIQKNNQAQQSKIDLLLKEITGLESRFLEKNSWDEQVRQNTLAALVTLKQRLRHNESRLINTNNQLIFEQQEIKRINKQLALLLPIDNRRWLISEAHLLIKLAQRKIWQYQDYATAHLLIEGAVDNLKAVNDSTLLPIIKAAHQDLKTITNINQINVDNIIIKLTSLIDKVPILPLVKNYQHIDRSIEQHDDSFFNDNDKDSKTERHPNSIWAQFRIWLKNIGKNLATFINNFVTIEKNGEFDYCIAKADNKEALNRCHVYMPLIGAEQSLYLRENIRFQLYIALQATIRQQNNIYQQSLKNVSQWVYAYFDVDDAISYFFIQQIEILKNKSIPSKNMFQSLNSAALLDKWMKKHVKT